MKEKIEQFLKEWERQDDNYQLEDSYLNCKYIEETNEEVEEIEFETELNKLFKNNDFTNYTLTYIGGFDSPGYDLSCYCLSIIEDEKLYTFPIKFEYY